MYQSDPAFPQYVYNVLGLSTAVFTMCYANAHPAIWQPTYTELYRGAGHRRYLKGYDCGPNSIVRNN